MKRVTVIASFVLLSLINHAESATNDLTPAIAVTPTNTNPEEAKSWRGLVTTLGVVGGVIIADLFMGGSLTSSLIGWGATTTAVIKGPIIYPPEILNARAAGAVLGEMITPATNLRDVAARQDMIYALMLGAGGTIGAVVSSLWASTMDSDMDNSPSTTK